jgi:alkylation response protein AidB-like acyl-CoA dehydrogenase
VDLDLTGEQQLLQESVRRTIERHCPIETVRALENDSRGYSPALWSALADLGVAGLLIPEEHGGAGMSLLDAAIVYEEFGRSLAPSPHFVSCVLSAGALARSQSELKPDWLPKLASGEKVMTVAWLEPDGGYGPDGVRLRAESEGDGYRLHGVKRHVPFAQAANELLVLARNQTGIMLCAVSPAWEGVSLRQDATIAGDAQFTVTFDNVRVDRRRVVAEPERAWAIWHDTMLDGAALLAAQAAGGARAALDLAVNYAKTRQQFDKPLGAFQALAHYLADATTTVDGAQTLAWEAAWARTEGRSIARLAPMAKSHACRTFRDVTAVAEQIFGGVGFTLDFDIQLYFRRAKSLQLNWWDDRYLDGLVAEQLLDVG